MTRGWAGLLLLVCLVGGAADACAGGAFLRIRIGDRDGFGFTQTAGLQRAIRPNGPGPADLNGNGILEPEEFLPDLNGDGEVRIAGGDEFDNRDAEENADRKVACVGCIGILPATGGSIWTDLSLTPTSRAPNWPDRNGPARPNNATFVFDFVVAKNAIDEGTRIFFNIVIGDYDVDPAYVHVDTSDGRAVALQLTNASDFNADGWIQARTDYLKFGEVFTKAPDGNWHGWVRVIFNGPFEAYTAFDYVELSILAAVVRAEIEN